MFSKYVHLAINAQHVEILSGITTGDNVITEGNTNLRNKPLIYTPEMKAEAEVQAATSTPGNTAITSGSNQSDEGPQE